MSLVRILPTSSSKSAPILFLRFWSANRALAAVAHFADLICQKCSESLSFVTLWSANLALATLVHILSRTSPDRTPQPWKQRPGPSRIIRKHKGFRTRECFRPWIRTLNCCYTSQLVTWWLTSWCGGHDGVTANHDHRPWRGSFPSKLPLMIFFLYKYNINTYTYIYSTYS